MTDRELLELAAKAAGYKIHIWGTEGKENIARIDLKDFPMWNPLSDDGDALRLAVKLGIVIDVRYGSHKPHKNVTACVNYWITQDNSLLISENGFDDYQRATRRCIVRAAAEIGKKLT